MVLRNRKHAIRRGTVGFISLYLLLFIIFFAVSKIPNQQLISDRGLELQQYCFYAVPVLFAFLASAWASRISSSYKRLWRLMAVGMLFWSLGVGSLLTYVIRGGAASIPTPSIADAFTIAYVPIMLGVLLSIARLQPPFDQVKKKFIIITTMASLATLLMAIEFMLLPLWHTDPNSSLLDKIFVISYPMFDWLILSSLLFASYKLLEERIEGWIIFLALSFTSTVVADIAFYINDNTLNSLTILFLGCAALFVALAAIDEVSSAFIGTINRPHAKHSDDTLSYSSFSKMASLLVPLVSALIIPIVWRDYALSSFDNGSFVLFVVSSLILLLAIYTNHRLAVDNAALFAKTLRDRLTGLNNHRYFHEALHRAVTKSKKAKTSLSIIIVDIDDFSKVNNVFGHVYGDDILSAIGREIISNLREADEACRLNGDEFGVILPDTSSVEAKVYAESLKSKISRRLQENFGMTNLTISAGISTYPEPAQGQQELLYTADGALYWAKINGKDEIVAYDPHLIKTLNPEERAKKAEEIALIDLVSSLARAVDARDKYTRLHSKGVSYQAKRLGKSLGLSAEVIKRIEISGLLHDVGKIGLPDDILNKPGRLSEVEMLAIKNHSIISAQIIESTSLKGMVAIVRAHHERWDGCGYPDGLKGEAIPLEARILAVADTFDAMTTNRPYRKALPVADALSEIDRCAGTQLDPKLAKAFVSLFRHAGAGQGSDEHIMNNVEVG